MNLRQKAKHFKRLYEKTLSAIEKLEKIEDLVNDCADESVDDTSCCARYIGLIEEVIYTEQNNEANS